MRAIMSPNSCKALPPEITLEGRKPLVSLHISGGPANEVERLFGDGS
ncbi:MAG: hypothetical protein N2200_09045 [Bacteroidia bacterium]|nr:hypothetical protein [Bacteroidia bacterium]